MNKLYSGKINKSYYLKEKYQSHGSSNLDNKLFDQTIYLRFKINK